MKVCILLGGASTERNVSIHSGLTIAEALRKKNHKFKFLDPATPLKKMDNFIKSLDTISVETQNFDKLKKMHDQYFIKQIEWIKEENFDIVFNALHGGNGENGVISAVLQIAGIPFTGSEYMASAIAMDKYRTKKLLNSIGVLTSPFELHTSPTKFPRSLSFPLVIKPNDAGSSVGLSIVKKEKNILNETKKALKYSREYIIEKYINGRELTAPIICDETYPLVEIVPKSGVYDYRSKYGQGMNEYIVPPLIDNSVMERIKISAKKVWNILGMKNYGRIDFRLNENNEAFCLEANTLPGMTNASLLPKSAKYSGLEFHDLIEKIITDVLIGKVSHKVAKTQRGK